jgi:transcriptional regulator with XRE-family HTH domain
MESAAAPTLGGLLREARAGRAITQVELAARLGVSQRHVSCVERGLARPSRPLLVTWLEAVQAPAALRNAALLHGGFANHRDDRPFHDTSEQLEVARSLLAAHEPWPAICIDADWKLVAANEGRRRFYRIVLPGLPAAIRDASQGVDMIEILAPPDGLLGALRDAPLLGWSLLAQLRAETWANGALRERVDAFERRLQAGFARPAAGLVRPAGATQLRLAFDSPAGVLTFQAVQLMVGLPQNITPASPRVTLWYPTDAFTRSVLEPAGR